MTFSLSARMGVLSTPIKGIIDVSDRDVTIRDVTIDADLGILVRLILGSTLRESSSARIIGLLT